MPASWVEHCGHSIIYVDYRGLGTTECVATLHEHTALADAARGPLLTLVDARGAVFGSEFMQAAKAAAPLNTRRTAKRAIVGVEGIKGVLLTSYNAVAAPVPLKPFATVDEALDYLARP
jgi:hypothetical protein